MEDPIHDVHSIVNEIRKSTSFSTLIQNWETLSLNLGIDSMQVIDFKRKMKTQTIKASEIPCEILILRTWVADQGTGATLTVLHDALVNSGLHDIAESLSAKFWKPESRRMIKFVWQGNLVTLEELLGESAPSKSYGKIFTALRETRATSSQYFQKPIQILKEKLNPPAIPKYYIPRTLVICSTELDPKLFRSYSVPNDLFLLEGINEHDLEKLFQPEGLTGCYTLLGRSLFMERDIGAETVREVISHQNSCVHLRLAVADSYPIKFRQCNSSHCQNFVAPIERDGDFDWMTANTSSPVHLIRHERGSYFWIKSNRGVNSVRQFLKEDEKFISEQELASNIIFYPFPNGLAIETNLNEFLTKYWIDQYGAKEGPILTTFAQQCLADLNITFTDKEKEIAGTLLRLMMLADVYAEETEMCSTLGSINQDAVRTSSLFQMYQKIIDVKFGIVQDPASKSSCVYQAIKLLFPDWKDTFKRVLNINQEACNASDFLVAGLMTEQAKNTYRFIHQSFAEYLVAEFLVQNLDTHQECVDLFFREIFGQKGTNKNQHIWHYCIAYWYFYELKYPVISYFIELHMKERAKQHPIYVVLLPPKSSRLFGKTQQSANFSIDDACIAVNACSSNDLEWAFDYAIKVTQNFYIKKSTRDKYFRDLPHLLVSSPNKFPMLKKLMLFMKEKCGLEDMLYHSLRQCKTENGPLMYYCTPVHSTIQMGKYDMFSFLIQNFGKNARKLFELSETCVRDTAGESESVIAEKLLILDMLVKLDLCFVNESKPLLAPSVHLRLLQRLVEHGADVNSCLYGGATVLHMSYRGNKYTDLVRWAFASGFNLVNHTNFKEKPPIMCAIKEFGVIEDEVLNLFCQAGADFNAQDKYGDSVLFYALKHSNLDLVGKIIEYGADVNLGNFRKANAAHQVIYRFPEKSDTEQILCFLKLLESNGFNSFDHKNTDGESSLDLARSKAKDNADFKKVCDYLQTKIDHARF